VDGAILERIDEDTEVDYVICCENSSVLIQTSSFTSSKEITAGKSMDLVDLGGNTNGELDVAVV